jgi:hypothetical protein
MYVTRFLLRVINEEPLNDITRHDLLIILEGLLKAQQEAGVLDAPRFDRRRPAITDIELNLTDAAAPKDASRAKAEGFLREDNPYPPGSAAHSKWDRAWLRTKIWDFR